MVQIGRIFSAILVPLLAGFIYQTFIKSENPNDLSIYNNVDWWADQSPFLGLLRSNAVRVPFFVKHFPKTGRHNSWLSVLDVGCGGGFLSEALAKLDYNVTGIDLSESAIINAKNHAQSQGLKNINYMVGSALNLPFPDASFDVVVASDVLEHIPDIDKTISEISRVLKPSGVFVFDCINKTWWSYLFHYLWMERVLGIIPRGAHDWNMFVEPADMHQLLASNELLSDPTTWVGRHWNISIAGLVAGGPKKFITGMYLEDTMEGFYMGFAIKET